MKVTSLFSGGGLGDFGWVAAGHEIVAQVEIDEYCQKILELRFPNAKKFKDIKTLKGNELPVCDIITGGFPCQPFSVAGKQKGKDDNRYLWPQMFRVIKEVRPRWVVGENVPGIINMALDDVCSDLESEGYEVWPIVFPSHALGAWHKRDRLWIVANARCGDGKGKKVSNEHEETNRQIDAAEHQRPNKCDKSWVASYAANTGIKNLREREESTDEDVPHANRTGREELRGTESVSTKQSSAKRDSKVMADASGTRTIRQEENRGNGDNGEKVFSDGIQSAEGIAISGNDSSRVWSKFWSTEPSVGRVASRTPNRVDRLKMLGNGQVPACTFTIGRFINAVEEAYSL
jgi:DNA (cytosine-5)-methyltransferase 1